MTLAAQKGKASTPIDRLLVEQNTTDIVSPNSVADEHRARGVRVDSYNGDCRIRIDGVLELAAGAILSSSSIPVERLPN